MSEKEQITIRVRQETADVLREESQKIGGSNQYMGQVIDDLVAENDMDNTEILKKLNEIDEKIENQTTPSTTSTHTTKTDISDELEEMVRNEETIDPEEFDLSQAKGTNKVMDVAMLVAKGKTTMFKEDIDELFRTEFDYSINSAREKRKKLMSQLKVVNDVDESKISEWIKDEIDRGWHIVRESGSKWLSAHRNVDNPEEWYREQYGGSLENYLTSKVDMDFETRYAHPEKYEEGLRLFKSIIKSNVDFVENEFIEERLFHVAEEVQKDIEELN